MDLFLWKEYKKIRKGKVNVKFKNTEEEYKSRRNKRQTTEVFYFVFWGSFSRESPWLLCNTWNRCAIRNLSSPIGTIRSRICIRRSFGISSPSNSSSLSHSLFFRFHSSSLHSSWTVLGLFCFGNCWFRVLICLFFVSLLVWVRFGS